MTGTGLRARIAKSARSFDVSVDRHVYDASGKELRHDTFTSHYIPDSPTTVYGPGRTPPGPYIVIPSSI